jgi:hypothetical protein
MLNNLENIIEAYIDKTPFLAKIYFGHELGVLKSSLENSRALRNSYEPTEQWYIDYANNLNTGFNAIYNAADRAYDTYDAIGNIPLIGKPICSMIEKNISKEFTQYAAQTPMSEITEIHLPQRETTLRAIENIGKFSSESIYAHYEASTGKSAARIRSETEFAPQRYISDPSPLRGYFIDALQSIGDFFSEMFGSNSNYFAGSY